MSLDLRLTILRDAGQISQETHRRITDAIQWLNDKRKLTLTEDNGAMLVTHLAVALERIQKNELVEPLAPMLLEEVTKSQHFADAQAITAELETVWNVSLPESERGFVLLHLCTLLDLVEGN